MSLLTRPESQQQVSVSVNRRLLIGALLLGIVSPVIGENLPVQNPSFENQVLSPGEATSNGEGLAPWASSPGEAVGLWDVSNLIDFPGGAPEGKNVAYSQGSSISQPLSETLVEGTTYALSLKVGNSPCCAFPGYGVQLLANGVVLVEDANFISVQPGTFEPVVISYTSPPGDANAGNPLEIRLLSLGAEVVFDHVQLTTSTSELPDWVLQDTNSPGSRYSHDMAYDSTRDVTVLFGGRLAGLLNDTWEFDGTSWSQILTDHSPPERFWHSMDYDSSRQRIVLFGGGDPDSEIYYNDTWEYDGTDWYQVATQHSPPGMVVKSMAYDSQRNRIVLVGGSDAVENYNDTWEYDGSDWTMVETPNSPPPPGTLAAMAYDASRERSVLTLYDNTMHLATWEYDGANWSEISTPTTPLGRWGHAMVFDASSQQVLLHGGYSPNHASGDLDETWAYNGVNWKRVITPNSTGPASQHSMAFDSVIGRVVATVWGSTWAYVPPAPLADAFDFTEELFGEPGTLHALVVNLNHDTGYVEINGVDNAQPDIPFDVDWGDGTDSEAAWFPFDHSYADTARNYSVTITANYGGGETDSIQVVLRFTAPDPSPVSLPAERQVIIDSSALLPVSRPFPGYPVPALTFFDDTFFDVVPRSVVEYVLHLAAELQHTFANHDVLEIGGGFQQHVLRDQHAGGMYSLWYTDPVSFGAGDYAFGGTIQYSSFFHEMGHNVSLNSPAKFHYGGRIDGNANAIFSETMAQIFAHATAYEILNDYVGYGIEPLHAQEIEQSTRSSMRLVRNSYDQYVADGAPFTSWNDPGTGHDETFGTFMTIAYKFFEHAENAGGGYEAPLRRMMQLLQLFDADMEARYDRHSNTSEAETFRSTLMVAALSFAFDEDLRVEMRELNFPIDDVTYQQLIDAADPCQPFMNLWCPPHSDPQSYSNGLFVQINGVVMSPEPCEPVARIQWDWGDGSSSDSWFPASHSFAVPDIYTISATAFDAGGDEIVASSCKIDLEIVFKDGFE